MASYGQLNAGAMGDGVFSGINDPTVMGIGGRGRSAGPSGMVAERGFLPRIPGGLPGGFWGDLSDAFSRSVTPNVPFGRHGSRGMIARTTSPRPVSNVRQRSLPQVDLEASENEARFLNRMDTFENELRRHAQASAVEHRSLELVMAQVETISTRVEQLCNGLDSYVLKPIQDLQSAADNQYCLMRDNLNRRMQKMEEETVSMQRSLATQEQKLNVLHDVALEVRTAVTTMLQQNAAAQLNREFTQLQAPLPTVAPTPISPPQMTGSAKDVIAWTYQSDEPQRPQQPQTNNENGGLRPWAGYRAPMADPPGLTPGMATDTQHGRLNVFPAAEAAVDKGLSQIASS